MLIPDNFSPVYYETARDRARRGAGTLTLIGLSTDFGWAGVAFCMGMNVLALLAQWAFKRVFQT